MARPKKNSTGNSDVPPLPGQTAGQPPAARTSVSMASELHRQLKIVAAEESDRTKVRTSVADLVEQAVLKVWFAGRPVADVSFERLEQTVAQAQSPAADLSLDKQRQMMLNDLTAASEYEFTSLFDAALADPIPDVIAKLEGTVQGTFALIQRRDLAYHLRSAVEAGKGICTLEELIADYEG